MTLDYLEYIAKIKSFKHFMLATFRVLIVYCMEQIYQ